MNELNIYISITKAVALPPQQRDIICKAGNAAAGY